MGLTPQARTPRTRSTMFADFDRAVRPRFHP